MVELTHLATLYHDDVMDEAAMRRGAPSANSRWDNSVAILVGDYLFAQASDLVSDLGTEAVRIQARTFSRLVQRPDPRDDRPRRRRRRARALPVDVVADKTGSLIATAARFGAKMAGAPIDVQETLTEFGERIGAAFQLADDIIDVASETGDSGKTPGTDLREGVPTLPTLIAHALDRCRRARGCATLLAKPLTDDAEHAEALDAAARPPGDGRGPRLRAGRGRRGQRPARQAARHARRAPRCRSSARRSPPASANRAGRLASAT